MLIPRPEGLHDSLQAAPSLTRLSLSEYGWLVELLTVIHINLYYLMPDEIKEVTKSVRRARDGPTYDESTGEHGMTVEWWTDETPYDDPHTRFVSWDELGTTWHLYDAYEMTGNYPYHPTFHYSGSMISASWGEDPKHFDLPDMGKCCNIIWTESGYVGLPDYSEAGYAPWWSSSTTAIFSADGETWDVLDRITEKAVWIPNIDAVNSGILAHGIELLGQHMGDASFYWIGSPDASEWHEFELPEGTILIEWLMANDRAPIDWPRTAVNGNIVLRIGDNGSIERYVAPE